MYEITCCKVIDIKIIPIDRSSHHIVNIPKHQNYFMSLHRKKNIKKIAKMLKFDDSEIAFAICNFANLCSRICHQNFANLSSKCARDLQFTIFLRNKNSPALKKQLKSSNFVF